jgi:glucosamine--fructose-6-phosphate aminotransferase (isomerizing)
MCGIVGYIGRHGSLRVIVDGLKRLEYRGYDSAGIAFQEGNGTVLYKTKGKLHELEKLLPTPSPPIKIGLGHTRWATHGVPSTVNAHPHRIDGVTVVHNGIIENYRDLKAQLQGAGRTFVSDTDTEVVPHLIARYRRQGCTVREAINSAIAQLQGSYALGIMIDGCYDTLYAVKKGSPLVIGIGRDEFYFASDIPAILPYTKKYIFVDDDHICTMTRDGIELQHIPSRTIIPTSEKIVELDWPPAVVEKSGYDHFMLKEIYEQPEAIRKTTGEWIGHPEELVDELGLSVDGASPVRRMHIVACGTSYHAGLIGKHLIERLAGVPVEVDIASEYRYRKPILDSGTVFISITQSGETADTLAAQREAARHGARTLTICNVVGSTASREAGAVLFTRAGLEIGVASTKTFTAQVAALFLIALGMGIKSGALAAEKAKALMTSMRNVPSLVEKTLETNGAVRKLAEQVYRARDFLYLGRRINYPVAYEGALKLKEISYIHAEGYPAGEMKHGPIALIQEGLPVVVVAPTNDVFEKVISNIEEVKARGGRVIAVTDSPEALKNRADDIIEVPAVHPLLSPFVTVIPLQLLAYHVGVLRGCDVDQPRNLAKSVTVE